MQTASEEAQVVDILHINSPIDFVFGDKQYQLGDDQWIVRDYDLMAQVLQIRHINTNFNHQKQLCMKLCMEVADLPTNQKFIRLIFNLSRRFPNSRSSSFQAMENDAVAPMPNVRYIVGHMWDP